MDALGGQEIVDVFDIIFHDLIDIGQMRHRLASLVDDEARASLIREVFYAFGGDNFDELDVPISLGDCWEMHVDEATELIAILVEVQHHKRLRVCFSDFPHILIPGNLNNLTIFCLLRSNLDLFHPIGHVLSGKLIIKIYINHILPRSSSISSNFYSFIRSSLFYSLFSYSYFYCIFFCS